MGARCTRYTVRPCGLSRNSATVEAGRAGGGHHKVRSPVSTASIRSLSLGKGARPGESDTGSDREDRLNLNRNPKREFRDAYGGASWDLAEHCRHHL